MRGRLWNFINYAVPFVANRFGDAAAACGVYKGQPDRVLHGAVLRASGRYHQWGHLQVHQGLLQHVRHHRARQERRRRGRRPFQSLRLRRAGSGSAKRNLVER